MHIRELISELIIPLKPTDSASLALKMMDENKILHLPVVDDLELKGMVSENDLLSVQEPTLTNVEHLVLGKSDYITEDQHPYDAIAAFSSGELSAIPLIDKDRKSVV